MADVLVLGCGLIGTSIGLALRGERDVALHDSAPAVVAEAVARGAGRAWDGQEKATTVVVAVPPLTTPDVLFEAQRRDLGQTYTHVASVQSQVQQQVETLGCDLSSIVGGHPLAGRESSGPAAATADLFVGRPWALCPSGASTSAALHEVRRLALDCGSTPVELDADAHDASVALLSHLPQVTASALAGLLVPEGGQVSVDPARVVLSGPGLADTTRLAASDPALWAEILQLNAGHVAPAVRALAENLAVLAAALEVHAAAGVDPAEDGQAARVVEQFLIRGNRGRAVVPVKRGEVSEAFGRVGVSVDDRPGRLAALLVAAGAAGVNVEDVHVEHVPGRPRGVIELLVDVGVVTALRRALEAEGWHVVSP
ncbi:MAG: Prephenate dehydrogenase [Frankiales bacterium]|nr:Prephenate dehydrogenase [Frankiales bacterium]